MKRSWAWLCATVLLAGAGGAAAHDPIDSEKRLAPDVSGVVVAVCPGVYQGTEYRARGDGKPGYDRVYRAGPDPCLLLLRQRDSEPYRPDFLRVDVRR
ncbi:MAG: hypothetical protein ACE5FL_03425 [Myxococcota bacterium]